jgi:hypothetical protein
MGTKDVELLDFAGPSDSGVVSSVASRRKDAGASGDAGVVLDAFAGLCETKLTNGIRVGPGVSNDAGVALGGFAGSRGAKLSNGWPAGPRVSGNAGVTLVG